VVAAPPTAQGNGNRLKAITGKEVLAKLSVVRLRKP
jgi:hypothetical protein